MKPLAYYHVDVFSPLPLAGNGLTIFMETEKLSTQAMQKLTQEMRQFESIFLYDLPDNTIRARIFTVEEELDFAGHPILGAAATLHDLHRREQPESQWTFVLNKKKVNVFVRRTPAGFTASMDQGKAEFGKVLDSAATRPVLELLGATTEDLYPGLWPTVVSTGLPYLIVPLSDNRFKARFGAPGLEKLLHAAGAKFIGLLDIATRSIRTGNNDGTMEDIATGSLAGPAGAFLVHHALEKPDTVIRLNQGHNLGRNSELYTELRTGTDNTMNVWVSGSVCKIAHGVLESDGQAF